MRCFAVFVLNCGFSCAVFALPFCATTKRTQMFWIGFMAFCKNRRAKRVDMRFLRAVFVLTLVGVLRGTDVSHFFFV